MNWKNLLIGIGLLGVSIILIMATEGALLPMLLPLAVYALKFMGVKLDA